MNEKQQILEPEAPTPVAPPAGMIVFDKQDKLEQPTNEVAPSAQVAMAQREVEAAVMLARKFPRDESESYQRLVRACKRPSFAAVVEYSYPRGGTTVRGLSVYFAREASKLWGNIRHGIRIIADTDEMRTIEAFAWDMETNVYVFNQTTFKKLVQRKRGGTTEWVVPDERDLRELTAKQGAILKRGCILEILPADVLDDAKNLARKTRESDAAADPDKSRKDVLAAFDSLNIPARELDVYLGVPIAQASPAQLAGMREVYASVRDGNSTWREHLDAAVESRTPKGDPASDADPLPGARAKARG